jgi:hypothetical protein
MSEYGNSTNAEGVTLSELVTQLRAGCEAITCIQGGHTYYAEELQIFRTLCAERGLFLTQAPAELARSPDEEGNEHQVWYRSDSATFLKATWANHFGMLVVHRNDEEPSASPIAYLERWLLHNELFGDTVKFIGALDTPQGMRLLIKQPAIKGEPATDEDIDQFFTESGWRRFIINGEIAYYDAENQVVISDTHRGNIILLEGGMLAPIDLRVQALDGALLSTVIQLTRIK